MLPCTSGSQQRPRGSRVRGRRGSARLAALGLDVRPPHQEVEVKNNPEVQPKMAHDTAWGVSSPNFLGSNLPDYKQALDLVGHALGSSFSQPPALDQEVECARNLGATEFSGTINPSEAEEWLQRLERVFELLGLTDERKVGCVKILLIKGASTWWQRILDKHIGTIPNWEQFKNEFYTQYSLDTYCEQKIKEFMNLSQDGMSVVEYEAHFTELSKFAPWMIATEEDKCRLFVKGLHNRIKETTKLSEHYKYSKLVELAYKAEVVNKIDYKQPEIRKRKGNQNFQEGANSNKKSKGREIPRKQSRGGSIMTQGRHGFGSKPGKGPFQRKQSSMLQSVGSSGGVSCQRGGGHDFAGRSGQQSSQSAQRPCSSCRRRHSGNCRRGSTECYHCGEEGHKKRECPLLLQGSNVTSRESIQSVNGGTSDGQSQKRTKFKDVGSTSSDQATLVKNGQQSNQQAAQRFASCGASHSGNCMLGFMGCYHCGDEGHKKGECPLLMQGSGATPSVAMQLVHGSATGDQSQKGSEYKGVCSTFSAKCSSRTDGNGGLQCIKHSARSSCSSCRRHHSGNCRFGSMKCYHCGKEGHKKGECPLLLQGSDVTSREAIQSLNGGTAKVARDFP